MGILLEIDTTLTLKKILFPSMSAWVTKIDLKALRERVLKSNPIYLSLRA